MKINKTLILLIILFLSNSVNANNFTFEDWLISFKKEALKKGISEIPFLRATFLKDLSQIENE